MKRLGEIAAGSAAILVLGAILFPVFAQTKGRHKISCLTHFKLLGVGLSMYAGDSDGQFPLRDSWMDAAEPYVKIPAFFRCTAMPVGTFGYAFNGQLSAAKPPKDPESVLLVYESVNPIRNASDPITSVPLVGRHDKRSYGTYADGHARILPLGRE